MPPKKILLAEDDADDQSFFLDFLQHRKDVSLLQAVENGEEALTFLEKAGNHGGSLPDLIILDQNMPKRNGLQTLQELKANRSYKNIPVLVYSTYADENLKKQSTALGAALVHPKPFTSEGYHQMMDNFLSVIDKG